MNSIVNIYSFKLTALAISLSLVNTVTIANSIELNTNNQNLTGSITSSNGQFGIYTKGTNALPEVNLQINDATITSGLSAIYIDKRQISGSKVGDTTIVVKNSSITTANGDADGIFVGAAGEGNINITTDDKTSINVKGQNNNSFGIAVQVDNGNKGNITVDNSAKIDTTESKGTNNSGLFLQSSGLVDGNISYNNKGQLNILSGSNGIHLSLRGNVTGNILAINEGKINANTGSNIFSGSGIYLEQRSNIDNISNIVNAGSISGFESAILATATNGVKSSVDILLTNNSDTTNNTYGIKSDSLENTKITIEAGSNLGAKNTAIYLDNKNNNQTPDSSTSIINRGQISSESGKLVHSVSNNKSQIAINNEGLMTGYIELLGKGESKIDNSGTWDMSGYTSNFGEENKNKNTLTNTGNLITANKNSSSSQTTIFENLGTFINTGTIIMENDRAGDITEIRGDYIGNNGTLVINTNLGDDSSLTDKLIITGHANGSTQLQVKNVGGLGAQTINGILVIETGSSESDQTFYLKNNYVSAGSYDYGLFLQNENNADNWYLKSHLRDLTPVYTPDVGSYLSVVTMGNTLFTSRLEDREGASQYQGLNNKDEANVWVRAYGGHHQFKSMKDQLKTKGNSFATQMGSGLVTLGTEDQYNLGVMGGFASYDGKTNSQLTGRESKAKIDGYSLGLYGTWYAHPVEKRGAYIDSWVLWNKFKNKIDTADENAYNYDSSGITASIEAGGDYLLNKNSDKNWWIQPQTQLIYQGVHADSFKDSQSFNIDHGKDNLQARLGFKTYLNVPTNDSNLTSYRPYLALNYIHNTNPYSILIDDVRYENEGSKNLGEIKLGIEGHVAQNSQIWLNASYIAGSNDNQAYQGNIGWKYNF